MICPTCGVEITSDKVYWLHVDQCVEPEIIETKEETPTIIVEATPAAAEIPTTSFGNKNLFG